MGTIYFLIHCFIYVALYTGALLIIALKNPRLLLNNYPQEIRDQVIQQTKHEIETSRKYLIALAVLCIMYPFVVTCYTSLKYGLLFWQTVLFSWRLMLFISIYSLVIVDWLVFCTITPRFIIIAGSEGNTAYKNYNIPFFKFLRTLVIITGLSLFNAFVIHIKL